MKHGWFLMIFFMMVLFITPAMAQGEPEGDCPCGADEHGECLPCDNNEN